MGSPLFLRLSWHLILSRSASFGETGGRQACIFAHERVPPLRGDDRLPRRRGRHCVSDLRLSDPLHDCPAFDIYSVHDGRWVQDIRGSAAAADTGLEKPEQVCSAWLSGLPGRGLRHLPRHSGVSRRGPKGGGEHRRSRRNQWKRSEWRCYSFSPMPLRPERTASFFRPLRGRPTPVSCAFLFHFIY